MNILIGVPTFENVSVETFTSIYNLIFPQEIEKHELFFAKGYGAAQSRNIIAKYAIQNEYDYILYVDSDIVLPPDALIKLLEQNTDITTGWYTCVFPDGSKNHSWVKFDEETKQYICKFEEYGNPDPNAVMDVDACGFGCVLVKTNIFRQLQYPYFTYLEYSDGTVFAEDIYFCHLVRCTLPDIKIRGIRSVKCGHIKRQILF